jgi:hypothetical protein
MRRLVLIMALTLTLGSAAAADPFVGRVGYMGPYQPYAHAPRTYYYNPYAPRYPFMSSPSYYGPGYYGRGFHWRR